jgi:hypothetical protein
MTDAASRPGAMSPPERTARPRWRGRDGAMGGVRMDDNDDGGDDNYPRVARETGAVGYAERRGWDRQK